MTRILAQIVVLMAVTCIFTGCSSFTSRGKRESGENLSAMSDSSANKDTANSDMEAAGIVPDLPNLEPIQEVNDLQVTQNNKSDNSKTVPKPENFVAQTDVDSPITVVRLPEAKKSDQKTTSEIQQVNFDEPIMEPLPDRPVVTGETRPNQWQGVNGSSVPEAEQGSSPQTTPDVTTVDSEQNKTLSMTPEAMSTDKTTSVIKPTSLVEKQSVKKMSLPQPMTDGSKPMESGVVLEELPEASGNTDSSNATSTDNPDIPDEIFELPKLSEMSETSTSLVKQEKEAKTTDESKEIQQCSAIESFKQLQMSSLTFVSAIRKKGDFTAVSKPYLFKPGQTLLIYMEIENPNLASKLNSGFEIQDSAGKKILAQSTSSDTPTGESSFFQYVKFALPDNVTPGDYSVRVWGQVPNEKDLASATMNFQVR